MNSNNKRPFKDTYSGNSSVHATKIICLGPSSSHIFNQAESPTPSQLKTSVSVSSPTTFVKSSNANEQQNDLSRSSEEVAGMISEVNSESEQLGNEPSSQMLREQDRFLPIANIGRIMKRYVPVNGKVSKEAKEVVQECISEFISFITSEASEKCMDEKRRTINGEDVLSAMSILGFDPYVEPLKLYLSKYRSACRGDKALCESTLDDEYMALEYDMESEHQSAADKLLAEEVIAALRNEDRDSVHQMQATSSTNNELATGQTFTINELAALLQSGQLIITQLEAPNQRVQATDSQANQDGQSDASPSKPISSSNLQPTILLAQPSSSQQQYPVLYIDASNCPQIVANSGLRNVKQSTSNSPPPGTSGLQFVQLLPTSVTSHSDERRSTVLNNAATVTLPDPASLPDVQETPSRKIRKT